MVAEALPTRARVLIIGSGGFIGSHFSAHLAQLGYEIVGMDLEAPAEDFGLAKFVVGDVRNKQDLMHALAGVDAVINLAAVHFDFGHADAEYFDTNDHGMELLLEAMSERAVKRLLFTSSIAVYGDLDQWADEETPPRPETPYGASKLAAEHRISQWVADDPERSVVIIRPCAVYGERNVSNMMNLIRQINSGFFVLFGSGKNVKATAYVGNLVEAMTTQFERMSPGVKVFNYADKPDLTVNEIVAIIRKALGKKSKPFKLPLWLGVLAATPFDLYTRVTGKNLPVSTARVKKLAMSTQVKADRIRSAGYEQRVTSTEGLKRMVEHYLNGRHGSHP